MIGTGYLGATHAACMAELGFEVLGSTSTPEKIAALHAGQVPFYEPGLAELLRQARWPPGGCASPPRTRRPPSSATCTSSAWAPRRSKGEFAADLRYVDAVGRRARPAPATARALVVGKSTVPVGTAARLWPSACAELAPAGADVELAWNPEFLREGFAVDDTLRPDRLVFGVASARAEQRPARGLRRRCSTPGVPLVVTDLATAELVKVAANAFLATKISFINAMAEVCEAAGADVTELAEALGLRRRASADEFLHAGLGFGGGCLPKDIRAFMARAGELGADQALTFLREVDAINLRRRARMVDLAREQCGGSFTGQADRRVRAPPSSRTPTTSATRPRSTSPPRIQLQGAQVTVYDPKAHGQRPQDVPDAGLRRLGALDAARRRPPGAAPDRVARVPRDRPGGARRVVASTRIVDGRNALDPARWRARGLDLPRARPALTAPSAAVVASCTLRNATTLSRVAACASGR